MERPQKTTLNACLAHCWKPKLPLYNHDNIPDYFLSGYVALGDSALFIPVTSPVQTAEELVLHFIAAIMGVLSDVLSDYEANKLTVEQYGGESHSFPVPKLEIHNDGLEISNWSEEVFKRFLAVTEFPERYYFSEDAWQQHCNPEPPLYFQPRMTACHQRERAASEAITFHPLSIPTLLGLLKHNIPIKPSAWQSFDHYKEQVAQGGS